MGNQFSSSTQHSIPGIPGSYDSDSSSKSTVSARTTTSGNMGRMFESYEHIKKPATDELRHAAFIWDQLAEFSSMDYAFAGSIVAILRGEDYPIHDIEIVVPAYAFANNARKLKGIIKTYKNHLAITPTNQIILILRENTGIALRFFAMGSHGYPRAFIPPYDANNRKPEHRHKEPTFRLQSMGYTNDRKVPVIRARMLLEQRLFRFNPDSTHPGEQFQNSQDVYDIKAFLKISAEDRDEPFPITVANRILPIVKSWIPYAEARFMPTTEAAVNEWRRLGLLLTHENISPQFRPIPFGTPSTSYGLGGHSSRMAAVPTVFIPM
jgi:hypothetical protein